MTRVLHRPLFCAAAAALALSACAPEIGDECMNSLDCSSQGSRLCDRTQPHGYCTLRGCERGTCPDEAVCVKFRPAEERLSTTWCMAKCDDDGDCRSDEGYRCTSAEDFAQSSEDGAMSSTETKPPEAEILGRATQRFCSLAQPSQADETGEPEPEEGRGQADAAASGEADAAASGEADAAASREP